MNNKRHLVKQLQNLFICGKTQVYDTQNLNERRMVKR